MDFIFKNHGMSSNFFIFYSLWILFLKITVSTAISSSSIFYGFYFKKSRYEQQFLHLLFFMDFIFKNHGMSSNFFIFYSLWILFLKITVSTAISSSSIFYGFYFLKSRYEQQFLHLLFFMDFIFKNHGMSSNFFTFYFLWILFLKITVPTAI